VKVESVEIHKSVDLLSDTCVIKCPGSVYGKALSVEGKVEPGARVVVELGYNDELKTEFEGWLQRMDTDDGSLIFNCEDDLFMLRKPVVDKQFKNAGLKDILQYVVDQTGCGLKVSCKMTITYDKFVISMAQGTDVLKKIQEETKGNIYIKDGALQVHPLYKEKGGEVVYSFQRNIETADLKYRRKEDRRVEVVVEATQPDGTRISERSGTTGGETISMEGGGMSREGMKQKAENEVAIRSYDGYEGSVTGWLIPWVEPTWTAVIKDADYVYKEGGYYVVSVTTTVDEGGGKRKVELGRRVR